MVAGLYTFEKEMFLVVVRFYVYFLIIKKKVEQTRTKMKSFTISRELHKVH